MGRSDLAEFIEYAARRSTERLLADLAKYEHSGPIDQSGQNYRCSRVGQNYLRG
jgi:hypothetical protein